MTKHRVVSSVVTKHRVVSFIVTKHRVVSSVVTKHRVVSSVVTKHRVVSDSAVCSDEGQTLETSAKHHIPQATNIPYQPC